MDAILFAILVQGCFKHIRYVSPRTVVYALRLFTYRVMHVHIFVRIYTVGWRDYMHVAAPVACNYAHADSSFFFFLTPPHTFSDSVPFFKIDNPMLDLFVPHTWMDMNMGLGGLTLPCMSVP